MTPPPQPPLISLLWAVLFALAHTQSPEFYSNQHQYYLHGFAQAGVGTLEEDWLANTKDPTPAYSRAVAAVMSSVGPGAFHVVYFGLLCLYFESMRRLVPRGDDLFAALFIVLHSAGLRTLSLWLTGVDWPWFGQAGLAAQYLLGPGLQPSAFGVLLVTSLACFVHRRPIWACALAATCAAIHTTYLLPAGLLVASYLVVLLREKDWPTAGIGGVVALALVTPTLTYTLTVFAPTGGDEFRESQRILAEVRIPHHAVVSRWLDVTAGVQIAVMLVGIWLSRRTRLFWPLAIPSAICIALTVVQVITGSHTLALMFPWRWSAVLMPVAVAVLLAWRRTDSYQTHPAYALLAVVAAGAGVFLVMTGRGFHTNDAELPLLAHVKETKQERDVYLIPTGFPKLKKESPASQSKTYAPPVRTGDAGIPVDLQRFRLVAEAPIYIDFKAPPYEAAEVMEWHRRMRNVERWYADRDWDISRAADEAVREGITHVVTAADKPISGLRLREVWRDESYILYRLAATR